MRGWIIFIALMAFPFGVLYVSKLVHNIKPSVEIVKKEVDVDNAEAEKLGYKLSENREYFRKIVFTRRKQTKGFSIEVKCDTLENKVYYRTHD